MYVGSTGCRMSMTMETSMPESSMSRRIGMRQGETSSPAASSVLAAFSATGGSLMMKVKIRKFVKSAAAARKKE